jgi:hypothetical protein
MHLFSLVKYEHYCAGTIKKAVCTPCMRDILIYMMTIEHTLKQKTPFLFLDTITISINEYISNIDSKLSPNDILVGSVQLQSPSKFFKLSGQSIKLHLWQKAMLCK